MKNKYKQGAPWRYYSDKQSMKKEIGIQLSPMWENSDDEYLIKAQELLKKIGHSYFLNSDIFHAASYLVIKDYYDPQTTNKSKRINRTYVILYRFDKYFCSFDGICQIT